MFDALFQEYHLLCRTWWHWPHLSIECFPLFHFFSSIYIGLIFGSFFKIKFSRKTCFDQFFQAHKTAIIFFPKFLLSHYFDVLLFFFLCYEMTSLLFVMFALRLYAIFNIDLL